MHSKLMIQNSLSILTVLDAEASVRCTQFLLIQGFWSCFIPQSCGQLYGRYIISVALVSCFLCMSAHVCSSIYTVHNRGKTAAHRSLIIQLALFPGSPLPEGSHRSPSSIEEQKKSGSRMPDRREINTKRCFPAHQHDCFL